MLWKKIPKQVIEGSSKRKKWRKNINFKNYGSAGNGCPFSLFTFVGPHLVRVCLLLLSILFESRIFFRVRQKKNIDKLFTC